MEFRREGMKRVKEAAVGIDDRVVSDPGKTAGKARFHSPAGSRRAAPIGGRYF